MSRKIWDRIPKDLWKSRLFGGSLELPMWLTDGFLVTFFGRWWGAVRIHMSHVQLPYMVNSHVVVGAIYAYMCTYSYCTRCTIHSELTCTRWWGQYTHTCVPTATVHGVPYTVNSRVVVGAIYAYMCTYSYRHTWCTVHGVLTCGGGGNIRIHVYLQLPYTVYHTQWTHMWWWGQYTHTCVPTATVHGATIHGELTCGGGGNIRIHVYLQLPYMVYRTRWTHMWWWGQYTHTCVPTATVHGVPYTVNSRVVVGAIYTYIPCTYSYRTWCTIHGELTCGGGGNICIHVYLQLPYTVYHTRWTHVWWWGQYMHTCVPTATVYGAPYVVYRTQWTHVWRGHSRVEATHVCRGHSRVGVTHVWDEPPKWNSLLLDISRNWNGGHLSALLRTSANVQLLALRCDVIFCQYVAQFESNRISRRGNSTMVART